MPFFLASDARECPRSASWYFTHPQRSSGDVGIFAVPVNMETTIMQLSRLCQLQKCMFRFRY